MASTSNKSGGETDGLQLTNDQRTSLGKRTLSSDEYFEIIQWKIKREKGELLDGSKDRLIPGMGPILKELKELREDGLSASKDPGKVGAILKPILDEIKNMTGELDGFLILTQQAMDALREQLKKGNKTGPTEEQKQIETENNIRKERQKAGNASVNHYHTFKISKSNNLENVSIEQTSKGFTGNQTIPQYNPDYNV
jgi:hypothetical protein